MTTVAAALAAARAKLPASEARLLLGQVMRQAPAWLIAHDDELLDEDALLAFAALVARRAGGEPVAYLLGYREFFGRRFAVSPAVLIPRPETELLVELAKARVGAGALCVPGNPLARREAESRVCRDCGLVTPSILDLGTGSGCIAITLALELPLSRVTAVDSSGAALQVAASNALDLGASLRLLQGDWLSGLDGECFDLIVSNPPYVAAADAHLAQGDLRHEPRQALVGGADGLDAIRNIVAAASSHLALGGSLMIEHGHDQADAVRVLMGDAGFSEIKAHADLAGILRVTVGRLPSTGEAPAVSY
ncbi:MAG: peptide chain release factor N(5)-glutamine methyltransferase [Sulfuritalea sp.]|nr:peptide chain release factor N(5)-glutamine methyltransferase [Sulfuritalea sp.]